MLRLPALLALLFVLISAPALAQPATTTVSGPLATTPFNLFGGQNKSSTAWTTTGVRYSNPSVTVTDTSSSGTVAAGYTDLFAGNAIATSNVVTFTNYYGTYFTAPTASTNVTMTNKWALGADSLKVNGALATTSSITASGLSVGTQVSCLGLSSINAMVLTTGACGNVLLSAINIWTGDQLFQSGRPLCDIRSEGALQNASHDDTSAFTSCYAIIKALGGGIIYVPPSATVTCIKSGPVTIDGAYIRIVGASQGTIVAACNTNNTIFFLEGDNSTIEHLQICGYGAQCDVGETSGTFTAPVGPAVKFDADGTGYTCNLCKLIDVQISGGLDNVDNFSSTLVLDNVWLLMSYGTGLIYNKQSAVVASESGSVFGHDSFFDNNWTPHGGCGGPSGSTTANWASSTSYAQCQIVVQGSYYYQNVKGSSCTSGATTPTLHVYRTSFTDGAGGCTWEMVAPTALHALAMDTGAQEIYLDRVDFTGATVNAFYMENSAAGTAPSSFKCHSCIFSRTIGATINLSAGTLVHLMDATIGGPIIGNSLITQNSFVGDLIVSSSQILVGTASGFPVNLTAGNNEQIIGSQIIGGASGAINFAVSNAIVTGNMLSGTGAGTGIAIGSVSFVNVTNNICGSGNFSNCTTGSPTSSTVTNNN